MSTILDKIESHSQKKLPFVVYRKPNESLVSAFFQKNDSLFYTKDFTENGFIFAPFNAENPAILIPENQSKFVSEEIKVEEKFNFENDFTIDEPSKEFHIQLVEKAIKKIEDQQFKKVVVSRKEEIQLAKFDVINTFKKLLQVYPTAMVYVWFHPKVGLWLGATPETLLKVTGDNFETMALAGTQLYNETTNVVWQQKEIEEQQFVTHFIVSNIQSLVSNLSVSEVETVKSGNLLHLKTTISGQLKTQNLNLITSLHPTPAVCGLPKEIAKKFILENENYKRSFYTGFLGELNFKDSNITSSVVEKSNLFVNLRCMEVQKNGVTIFIGGGITKDSNPKKEWEETVAKASVMKRVL